LFLLIRVTASDYIFGIFKLFFINKGPTHIDFNCIVFPADRDGLLLRQNKHVLMASRGKGHHKNPATRQFILSARGRFRGTKVGLFLGYTLASIWTCL